MPSAPWRSSGNVPVAGAFSLFFPLFPFFFPLFPLFPLLALLSCGLAQEGGGVGRGLLRDFSLGGRGQSNRAAAQHALSSGSLFSVEPLGHPEFK